MTEMNGKWARIDRDSAQLGTSKRLPINHLGTIGAALRGAVA